MTRAEFMERLKMLLSDISESEREEALGFYEDYFDDAGAENEQSVIEALGSPERVAETIKEGLSDVDGEQGEFSENGFSGYGDTEKDEVGHHGISKKQKLSDWMKGLGTGGMVLILVLAIFALPVLGKVLIGIISAVGGILVTAATVLFIVAIVGIALIVGGVTVFAAACASLIVNTGMAMILFGVSLILIGIGIALTILGIWIVWKILPPIIHWIDAKIRSLFKKKEE